MLKTFFLLFVIVSAVLVFSTNVKVKRMQKIIAIFMFSILTASAVFGVVNVLVIDNRTIDVSLTALNEKTETAEGTDVCFRGVSVDGVWYHAAELTPTLIWDSPDNMVLLWKDEYKNESVLDLKVPYGESVLFVFDSDKWQGKVSIKIGAETYIVDNYANSDATVDKGTEILTNIHENTRTYYWVNFITLGASIVALIILAFLFKVNKENVVKPIAERQYWIDVLRVFLPFIVVVLHCTCNTFLDWFDLNDQKWYMSLYLNCFTSAAVPMFFMLSGATLLKRKIYVDEGLKKRIIKVVIPLFFWSILYILLNKFYFHNGEYLIRSLFGMLFNPQYAHLWFMYTLLGLYFLLPIISHIYHSIDRKILYYLLIIIVAIPSIIVYSSNMLGIYIALPSFAIFFPELGLFILGAYLTDGKKNWCKNTKLWTAICAVSFMWLVVSVYWTCVQNGAAVKSIFSSYGNTPTLLFSISFFMLIYSLETKWKNFSKKTVCVLQNFSSVSMGVYFSHMLVLVLIGNVSYFTNNSGTLLNMLAGAILYYVVAATICLYGISIPKIGFLFGDAKLLPCKDDNICKSNRENKDTKGGVPAPLMHLEQ